MVPGRSWRVAVEAGSPQMATAKKKRKLVERDVVARVIEADSRER